MPLVERIHEGSILGFAALLVVGAVAAMLYGIAWLQAEAADKPIAHPTAQAFSQPHDPTPAELAKIAERNKLHQQHYDAMAAQEAAATD